MELVERREAHTRECRPVGVGDAAVAIADRHRLIEDLQNVNDRWPPATYWAAK